MKQRVGRAGARLGRVRRPVAVLSVMAAAALLQVVGVNPAASQTQNLVARRAAADPGLDPSADPWGYAPPVDIQLSAQQVTYPMGGGSMTDVSARALHYDDTLYLRLEWDDPSVNESTTRPEQFSDAVAIEFPAKSGSSVPSACMGQLDSGVNIWQWRADSQKGRPDDIKDLAPDGYVDLYPSKDDLFYPARALGNPYAVKASTPVQNLVAEGFGTLTAVPEQGVVQGHGTRVGDRWAVVFARPFTPTGDGQPGFTSGAETDVAFAVWNGGAGDRNGKKSVTPFVKLMVSGDAAPTGDHGKGVWPALGFLAIVLALFLTMQGGLRRRSRR